MNGVQEINSNTGAHIFLSYIYSLLIKSDLPTDPQSTWAYIKACYKFNKKERAFLKEALGL